MMMAFRHLAMLNTVPVVFIMFKFFITAFTGYKIVGMSGMPVYDIVQKAYQSGSDKSGCGNKGCLEQYASATGIVRLARQKLGQEMRPTILNKQDVTAKDVFDAVKAGDEVAKEIATAFGRYLGYGLANLAVVADPAVFVIGGGVSKAGEVLIPYIREPYMERAFFANKNVRFVLAKLGNDAGICGAAKLVLDNE